MSTEIVEEQTPVLAALEQAAARLGETREAMAADVLRAKDLGCTWREIAGAVGMTEAGVAKLARRARGSLS